MSDSEQGEEGEETNETNETLTETELSSATYRYYNPFDFLPEKKS